MPLQLLVRCDDGKEYWRPAGSCKAGEYVWNLEHWKNSISGCCLSEIPVKHWCKKMVFLNKFLQKVKTLYELELERSLASLVPVPDKTSYF